MASFTGCRILDAERHAEAMAGAAEFTLIHLLHHPALVRPARRYDRVMAVSADISFFHMRLMAKLDVAGAGGQFIADRTRGSGVTFRAVALYAKSRLFIVARTARFALLHLGHGVTLIARAGNKQVGMALLAAVGGDMHRVGKLGAAGAELNLFHRMAFLAVGFHPESGLVIMARAARAPLFHISHGCPHTLLASPEYRTVALTALEHVPVNSVAENGVAGFLDFKDDVHGRIVAFITIPLDTEHGRTVVTTAARSTFLHLRHGSSPVVLVGAEQLAMTVSTGINSKMLIVVKAGIV